MIKHLWHICTDGDQSVWSCWVRTHLIRNQNFWEMKIPGDCSWAWRKILKLRQIAREKIRYQVGDGSSISLWYDNWHPVGPLICKFGERIIRISGLGKEAKVEAIVEGSDWRWPTARSPVWLELQRATPSDFRPNRVSRDRVKWVDDTNGRFTVKSAWEGIRPRGPVVEWYKIVWHGRMIPRHALILWLAIRGRLNTQDKLHAYGILPEICCALCRQNVEDLNHLFFTCPFSERIWRILCDKSNLPWVHRSWGETVHWMTQNFKGKSLRSVICRLMFAAAVYAIWRERNSRIFNEKARSACNVLHEVLYWVRERVNSLHGLVLSQENRWLQRSWNISEDVFRPG